MIRDLLKATALGLALGFTLGALASAADAQVSMPPGSSYELIKSIREAGYTVYGQNGPSCSKHPGIMGYVNFNSKSFAICEDNIQGRFPDDPEGYAREYTATLKHEAFHVAQGCNGRQPIAPTMVEFNIDLAQGVTDWHILAYEVQDWPLEAEAHLAQHLEYSTITNYVDAYCKAQ